MSNFEVKMRATGPSGTPNLRDYLSLLHRLTLTNLVDLVVRISGEHVVLVPEKHHIPISAHLSGEYHTTGCGSLDRRPRRSGNVYAIVPATISHSIRRGQLAPHRPDEPAAVCPNLV